jgi:hypothetical protein
MIYPEDRFKFDELCGKTNGIPNECSQFVREAAVIFAPDVLDNAGIRHWIVAQLPDQYFLML